MRTKREKIKRSEFNRKDREFKIGPRAAQKEIVRWIKESAQLLCEVEGMELVHVECQRESARMIIRLYIDRPGGVTLDDCVHISRQMNNSMDVDLKESDFENIGPYNLEVSSPGPNRPLGERSDFERFKGQIVEIKTLKPVEEQKKFKGVLLGMSEETVELLSNDKTIAIPFKEITRACLINYNGENRCL
ncbi:MAG TPA: ribosome maturation factor RimP [Anaerolineae bacterium]|nr:ribosome maturation factor RimP [Anaerolineae bacterium]